MEERESGYTEIEHTADWALMVWAPDLASLLAKAARGMYWLMETSLQPGPRLERIIELDGGDAESLLVGFLAELLYLGESEALAFDSYDISIQDLHLYARVRGAPVAEQKKEIKAVTYHNLMVEQTDHGLRTTIVFDV